MLGFIMSTKQIHLNVSPRALVDSVCVKQLGDG